MFCKILMLSAALAPCHALAQSTPVTDPARLTQIREPAKKGSAAVVDVGRSGIGVSKTAFVDGENVCGEIRISNGTHQTVTLNSIVDYLEVHFPRGATPPVPPPAGSTSNWFKVADVPISFALPASNAPGATTTIPYCFSLCLAADSPGANSMRNVVTVTVTVSGLARAFTTRSLSFPPPVLDCQACCLPDGSCTDTVPNRCASAGGLPRGMGTDCATSECTQACCNIDGTCSDETVSACLAASGVPRGLGTDCATAGTSCLGACCWEVGCTDGVSNDTCVRLFPGTFLGYGSTCDTQQAACPTGACCESFDSCIDFASEQYHVGKARCEDAGGTFQGDGTVCADRSCAGACCWAIGCTNEVSQDTCERQFDQGVYLGNDTTCETQFSACSTGACCTEGECIDFASEDYHVGQTRCEVEFGGTLLGTGSTCAAANTSCRGACCWEVGCNNDASPEECADDFNGNYLGNDTTCQSEMAVCPTGACCFDESCLGFETLGYGYSPVFCGDIGGEYLGNGAPCTSTSCCISLFGSCATDSDCCSGLVCTGGLCDRPIGP